MAKIGTAHIEIKPVINEEALDKLGKRIEDAVAKGVRRGTETLTTVQPIYVDPRYADRLRVTADGGLAQ